MPSQEDYLDQLLRGMEKTAADEEPEVETEPVEEPETSVEIEEQLAVEEQVAETVEEPEMQPIRVEEVYEEPAREEPVIEEPIIEEKIAEEIVVEEPVIEEPIEDEESVTEEDLNALFQSALNEVQGESFSEELSQEEEDSFSEEDIERMLNESRMEEPISEGSVQVDEDLMSLLGEASESSDDLQDIQDMLRKSDNNEALDNSVFEASEGESELDRLLAEMEEDSAETQEDSEFAGLSEKEKKALMKKKAKEEKIAKKKAEKEAKKAEKAAKKAAKKAPKQEEQEEIQEDLVLEEEEIPEAPIKLQKSEVQDIPDALVDADGPVEMDMSELDALLGLANPVEAEEEMSIADLVGAEVVDAAEGIDISDISELGEMGDSTGKEAEPVALDADELDALIEDKDAPAKTKEKKGLFAKILDFLTEEDEEDSSQGTEDVPLSDENREILEEMDKEGKKGKKKKAKKGKKGKDAAPAGEEGEEEDGGGKDSKKKPKKEKKPKKVKEPKEKEPVDPKNKITLKKLLPIIIFGVSLLVVIILLTSLGGEFTVKREAKQAFYREDYETCYQNLFGKKLSESEQIMFGKSESILRIRLWMREYEMFVEEGSELEAVDVLIQAVNDYSDLYEYAAKWNADSEVAAVYSSMLEILQNKYHLSEAQALEIAHELDDVEYTRKVLAVANGLGSSTTENPSQGSIIELPDILPEEKQLPENNGGR